MIWKLIFEVEGRADDEVIVAIEEKQTGGSISNVFIHSYLDDAAMVRGDAILQRTPFTQ